MIALAIAYFGWAFLAADYYQNGQSEVEGKTNFFLNAFEQLPNIVPVLSHATRNRLGR